jgi:hypothetical protein
VIYSLKVDQPIQQKFKKKILQRYVIYISDQITVPYLNIETGNRRLNIGGWYVFARREGLKMCCLHWRTCKELHLPDIQ